jgi:phosphocarrier protein
VNDCSLAKPPVTAAPAITRALVLRNRLGLHARPAALIVKTLQDFQASVDVLGDGQTANARSILGLLSLAAGYGSQLTFTASGPDAVCALEAVQRLFDTNFREAY